MTTRALLAVFAVWLVAGCYGPQPSNLCEGVICAAGNTCYPGTGVCLSNTGGGAGGSGGGKAGGPGGSGGTGGSAGGSGGGSAGGIGGGVGGGFVGFDAGTSGCPGDGGPCSRLPPTGLTSCYAGACPGVAGSPACATTAYCGQDAQYRPRTRVFTSRTVGTEVVISDSRTGLNWMKSNFGPQSAQSGMMTCTASTFAGLTGWRLPEAMELIGLFDLSRSPPIDPVFAPPPQDVSSYFYSATVSPAGCGTAGTAYVSVNFSNVFPEVGSACSPLWSYNIRCVRGPAWNPSAPNRFVTQQRAGQAVVIDSLGGLEWQGGTPWPVATWVDSLGHCEGLNWGGSTDWRLPDFIELESIAGKSAELGGPSIGPQGLFVSSSIAAKTDVLAVRINDGLLMTLSPAGPLSMFPTPSPDPPVVRCVRLGR